jgi:hypothetical protein
MDKKKAPEKCISGPAGARRRFLLRIFLPGLFFNQGPC